MQACLLSQAYFSPVLQNDVAWESYEDRHTGSFRLAAGYILPDENGEDDEEPTEEALDGLLMLLKASKVVAEQTASSRGRVKRWDTACVLMG